MFMKGEKYACDQCIRGHRVSSCQHHDRPLHFIASKGRPVSTASYFNAIKEVEASQVRRDSEETPSIKSDWQIPELVNLNSFDPKLPNFEDPEWAEFWRDVLPNDASEIRGLSDRIPQLEEMQNAVPRQLYTECDELFEEVSLVTSEHGSTSSHVWSSSEHASSVDGEEGTNDPYLPMSYTLGNSAVGSSPHSAKSKPTPRITVESRSVLQDWLIRHFLNPYPDQDEKAQLSRSTGLTVQQVSDWFSRTRSRKMKRQASHVESTGELTSEVSETMEEDWDRTGIPIKSARAMPEQTPDPMQRFLSTPPEDDPAPLAAIASAAAASSWMDYQSNSNRTFSRSMSGDEPPQLNNNLFDNSFPVHPSVYNPTCTDKGYDSMSMSGISNDSQASHASWSGRQGRKRHRIAPQRMHAGKYQCTWCRQGFKRAYEWQRHEESQHAPQTEYVCFHPFPAHSGKCILCDESNATIVHYISKHDAKACISKPLEKRSFARRDHMIQHIRRFHNPAPYISHDWEIWRRPVLNAVPSAGWRCGFCSQVFRAWASRASHIQKHFEQGCRMEHWDINRKVIENPFDNVPLFTNSWATTAPDGHKDRSFLSMEDPTDIFPYFTDPWTSNILDAGQGMVAISQTDITPGNIYVSRSTRGSDGLRGFPATLSSSSSLSSANNYPYYASSRPGSVDSLPTAYSPATSESYEPMGPRTLPRPTKLLGANLPPAPQSTIGQFGLNISSNTQKKYKCNFCDKSFTRAASLQTHMYSHTGEKPFACDLDGCGRRFCVVSNLRRHKKVHHRESVPDSADDD